MKNERKRVYRVESANLIVSSHKTSEEAFKSLAKAEKWAAQGVLGLTPETLLSVTRWNGSSWVAISEVK